MQISRQNPKLQKKMWTVFEAQKNFIYLYIDINKTEERPKPEILHLEMIVAALPCL